MTQSKAVVSKETHPKRINIKEFREEGYLQEVNRQFFHPLGLALEVVIHDDESCSLGGVWDYRDDPEGIKYAGNENGTVIDREKTQRVQEQADKLKPTRLERFGWVIQPVDDDGEYPNG